MSGPLGYFAIAVPVWFCASLYFARMWANDCGGVSVQGCAWGTLMGFMYGLVWPLSLTASCVVAMVYYAAKSFRFGK